MNKNEPYSVKREIMEAVMQLMAEKSYMEISVTDIIKKAGVARASFYRNFDTINDVIDLLADNVAEEMETDVLPTLSGNDERLWREFLFNHFYRTLKLHREMPEVRFENMSVIFDRINNRIQRKENEQPPETLRDKYAVIAKWALINNIARKWVDSGAKETPEEMIDYIMSFITTF